ncbi:MAG: formylglycine-generating enzyme family protein [Acidobacteriota bacterium]
MPQLLFGASRVVGRRRGDMNRYNSNKFSDWEKPRHRVTISYSFKMGKYEVTQEQWYKVMGNNPSKFESEKVGGDSRKHPVEQVSWDDVQEFIRRLNSTEETNTYRLPSEAEWEYACRAGTTTHFAFGSSLSSAQANINGVFPYGGAPKGIYREKTLLVGSFAPNAFGIFDMHGNVWEWCKDDWHGNYKGAPIDGSAWIEARRGSDRMSRGGSWDDDAVYCRSAFRSHDSPGYRNDALGFRLVRT